MASSDDLPYLVLQSTWSLKEAAHLVHSVNPVKNPAVIVDTSDDPVSRTFYWLKKEFEKDRLYPIGDDDENPRFSPGTLMRHLEEKGHYVSPGVRHMYDAAHGHYGMSSINSDTREVYVSAADLIWEDDPDRPAATVAKELIDLPNFFTKYRLLRPSPDTIRKWLRGRGPGKKGRPKGGKSSNAGKPDIAAIGKKLSKN